jgi:hypothetical protein
VYITEKSDIPLIGTTYHYQVVSYQSILGTSYIIQNWKSFLEGDLSTPYIIPKTAMFLGTLLLGFYSAWDVCIAKVAVCYFCSCKYILDLFRVALGMHYTICFICFFLLLLYFFFMIK